MTQTLLKRTCEWVDCERKAAERYRGHWLCSEHLDNPQVRENIDEEIEDEEQRKRAE
jgi:hypothetical protein